MGLANVGDRNQGVSLMAEIVTAVEIGNHIAGASREARSGQTFESHNPARWSDLVGVFPRSDAADVEDAAQAAKAALPGWRATPWPARGAIVLRAAELLEQ